MRWNDDRRCLVSDAWQQRCSTNEESIHDENIHTWVRQHGATNGEVIGQPHENRHVAIAGGDHMSRTMAIEKRRKKNRVSFIKIIILYL